MIELIGVSKKFGDKTVLERVSLRLDSEQILFLAGPSGIGKSTLLEIIAGLIKADIGSVKTNGPISLMFQDNVQIPWLSALGNLMYILPGGEQTKASEKKARYWLERFGLEADTFPSTMSGGMRRRLGLARTFAVDRPIVLLDEPFAFLDLHWQGVITEIICQIADRKAAVAISGHFVPPLLSESAGQKLIVENILSSPVVLEMENIEKVA
jgi:ABC-type nitrate/sulfonate/bicarbonate transport system ATPase subunit